MGMYISLDHVHRRRKITKKLNDGEYVLILHIASEISRKTEAITGVYAWPQVLSQLLEHGITPRSFLSSVTQRIPTAP